MNISLTPLNLVRLLKGASLSCLYALLLTGAPVRVGWLCRATGYSRPPVTDALERLEDLGLAARDPNGACWQITPAAAGAFRAMAEDLRLRLSRGR